MIEKKKRILIMTCSHGSGHSMVTQTLKNEYEKNNCIVEVFDVFHEYNRLLNLVMEKLYLLSYKSFINKIYGFLYYTTEKNIDQSLDKLFYPIFKDLVLSVIDGFKPDLIVNTYNHRTVYMNKEKFYPKIPVISVVTEFTLPSFWIHPGNDRYYLASNLTKDILLKENVKDSDIIVSGIPVRNNFFNQKDKNELLKKYNLDPTKKTLVIFAGTFGVSRNIHKICDGIDFIDSLQTLVVCGFNKKLYKKLNHRNYNNIQILRYISDIDEIYQLADILVTKPGGTVLSEVVYTKVPTILYDPVPGQELENAKIFYNQGACLIAKDVNEVLSQIIYLKEHEEKCNKMIEALDQMRIPNSAELIVKDSLELIHNYK